MSTLAELEPYVATLRAGARQGMKQKALATLLKTQHSVEVNTPELLRRWCKQEPGEALGEGVAGNANLPSCSGAGVIRRPEGVTRGRQGGSAVQAAVADTERGRAGSAAAADTERGGAGHGASALTVKSQEGLDAYAEALKASLARGLGARAMRTMLLEEHGITVSSDQLLRTWIAGQRVKEAGARVGSQGGLEPHSDALRAGLASGLGVTGLSKMLLQDHGAFAPEKVVRAWVAAERRKEAPGAVISTQEGLEVHAEALKAGLARGHAHDVVGGS